MIAVANSESEIVDLGSSVAAKELQQLRRDKAELMRQLEGQRKLIAALQARPTEDDLITWRDEVLSPWIIRECTTEDGRQIKYTIDTDCWDEDFIPCEKWQAKHGDALYQIELLKVEKRVDGHLATIYTVTRME